MSNNGCLLVANVAMLVVFALVLFTVVAVKSGCP
jgi:hypothetical protein